MTKDELIDRIYHLKIARTLEHSIEAHILSILQYYVNDDVLNEAINNVITSYNE